jgi:signal transduction histidine kinase
LASIIEKRLSLHQCLAEQQRQKDALQSHIAHLQVLANIGTVSYMIAHEINNLLTPVSSYAALALKNPDDKALARKVLEKTVRNCECASKIMESMLALANGENQQKQKVQLITLIEEIFSCLCRDFGKDGITVEIQIPQGLSVWAVPVQIQQVLMNLILNARDAMLPGGGLLAIRAIDKPDAVQIEVSDTGCGIKPADLKNIFVSFFTTKKNKNSTSQYSGSGLGLAFCKKVIEAHDGLISVESEPDKGSTFKISLPKNY